MKSEIIAAIMAAHQTVIELRQNKVAVRLPRWAAKPTWTPWEAALLVTGFDPATYCKPSAYGADVPAAFGLDGGNYAGEKHFAEAHRIALDWEELNNRARIKPHEFIAWCSERGIPTDWLRTMQTAPLGPVNKVTPMQRAAAQDAEILAELRKLYDPLALPKYKPGKPGVKAEIKKALGTSGIWAGSTVFRKAWERLSESGAIAYAT